MSTQAATDFFNKLYTDPRLQKTLEGQLGNINHPNGDYERSFGEKISESGKQNGFDFDADEARDAYKIFLGRFSGNLEGADAELSDSDLTGIAGGLAAGGSTSSHVSTRFSNCCITC